MLCKKCNEEIYSNNSCPFCGQKQTEDVINEVIEEKSCDSCTEEYSKYNEKCDDCPANPTKNTPINENYTPINNIHCKRCKKETPSNLRFCIHCGYNNFKDTKFISFKLIVVIIFIIIFIFGCTVTIIDSNKQKEETLILQEEKSKLELNPRNFDSIDTNKGKIFVDTTREILIEVEEINTLKKQIIFEYFKNPSEFNFKESIIPIEEKLNNVITKTNSLDTSNKVFEQTKMILLVNHVSPCIEKTIYFSAGVILDSDKYLKDTTLTESTNDYEEIKAYLKLIAQKSGFKNHLFEQNQEDLMKQILEIKNNTF